MPRSAAWSNVYPNRRGESRRALEIKHGIPLMHGSPTINLGARARTELRVSPRHLAEHTSWRQTNAATDICIT
jgi:hypothetical protein